MQFTPLTTDANPDGKGYLTESKPIKESEKYNISCKKILLFYELFILRCQQKEAWKKFTLMAHSAFGFGSIPPPSASVVYLLYRRWKNKREGRQVEGQAEGGSWSQFWRQVYKLGFLSVCSCTQIFLHHLNLVYNGTYAISIKTFFYDYIAFEKIFPSSLQFSVN